MTAECGSESHSHSKGWCSMLCKTCKVAGKQLTRGNVNVAKALHEKCEYIDCTCMHETVSVMLDTQTTGRPSS
jgi:hypothetical protein